MRLKTLSFRNVGPFGHQGVTLSGFSDGLNVVCETNEFGKSTVLKALEAILFKPFSSADKHVKALRTTASDAAIEGEITFTDSGRDYRFYKRFLKSKGARLEDAHSGEVLAENRTAEEALARILRADQYNGGPSGLLWVRQGTSMEGIADDGQIASRLEGELGTLVGGARARGYLARVETELAEMLTAKGQEKKSGPLRMAREKVVATKEALEAAKRQRDHTKAIGLELIQVTSNIERMSLEAEATTYPEQIKETKEAIIAARGFAHKLELAEAQVAQIKVRADRSAERQTAYVTALLSYTETRKALDHVAAVHEQKRNELLAAKARHVELREIVADLEARWDIETELQGKRDARSRQIQRLEILQKDIQHLNACLEQYRQLEDKLSGLTQVMSDLPVIDRGNVEELRRVSSDLQQTHAEMSGISTRLYLELHTEGAGKVQLDGTSLQTGPIELSGSSSLVIEGVGELRSDDTHLRDVRRKHARAQAEYEVLLARLAVSDIAQASKIADHRFQIAQDRKILIADLTRLAPQGVSALETEFEAAESEARSISEQLQDAECALDQPDQPDILETLRTERAQLVLAETVLTQAQQALTIREQEQVRLQERLSGLNLAEDEIARKAEADTLASEKLKADTDMRAAIAAAGALKTEAPNQSLDMLSARLTRLEQAQQQSRETLDQLKTKAAVLRAQRDAAFEDGDAEGVVASLEAQCDRHEEDLARLVRAKDVRVLLRDTLVATQKQLQESYTAPVTKELAPLLSRVMPGAEAGLSDRLGVDTVLRNGKIEAITQLSGGTQEQFAILTRLAYARLLARSGASAPVILDDALVYADDARRDAMFDVLGLVSSGDMPIQIIYLSCHAGATARLGGTRISPQPWVQS